MTKATLLGLLLPFTACGGVVNGHDEEIPAVHRQSAATCDRFRPTFPTVDQSGECYTDQECRDGNNGRCVPSSAGSSCTYDACFTDADCSQSADPKVGVCLCGEGSAANRCVLGNCRTDHDCASGYCSPSLGTCGTPTGIVGYFCHQPVDECSNDVDCTEGGTKPGHHCAYFHAAGHFACSKC